MCHIKVRAYENVSQERHFYGQGGSNNCVMKSFLIYCIVLLEYFDVDQNKKGGKCVGLSMR
jgi:hypothetical protein